MLKGALLAGALVTTTHAWNVTCQCAYGEPNIDNRSGWYCPEVSWSDYLREFKAQGADCVLVLPLQPYSPQQEKTQQESITLWKEIACDYVRNPETESNKQCRQFLARQDYSYDDDMFVCRDAVYLWRMAHNKCIHIELTAWGRLREWFAQRWIPVSMCIALLLVGCGLIGYSARTHRKNHQKKQIDD